MIQFATVEGVDTPVIVLFTCFAGGVGVAMKLLWAAFLDRLRSTEKKLEECETDRLALWARVNDLAKNLSHLEGHAAGYQQAQADLQPEG